VLVGALCFAALVLATSMPASALLAQHRTLSALTAQLRSLQAEDRALQAQVGRLGDPSTVEALARSDYGFVLPGQKAYVVLPPAGSTSGAAATGHVPLDIGPVAPGSALSDELLAGGAMSGTAGGTTADGGQPSAAAVADRRAGSGGQRHSGFWSRVAATFEFWR